MSEPSPKSNRPGDPLRALETKTTTTCWFCKRPNPHGTDLLGGTMGGGSKIDVCAPGEGCKDGRIFHGPQGFPHYPDQDCPICGTAEVAAARRLAGNTAKKTPARKPRRR